MSRLKAKAIFLSTAICWWRNSLRNRLVANFGYLKMPRWKMEVLVTGNTLEALTYVSCSLTQKGTIKNKKSFETADSLAGGFFNSLQFWVGTMRFLDGCKACLYVAMGFFAGRSIALVWSPLEYQTFWWQMKSF